MSGIFSSTASKKIAPNPGGTIALEFNEEPSIGFYTKELPKRQSESKSSARIRSRLVAEIVPRRPRHTSHSLCDLTWSPSPDRPHNVQRVALCNFGRQACDSAGRSRIR
jgi:hypothetical protein